MATKKKNLIVIINFVYFKSDTNNKRFPFSFFSNENEKNQVHKKWILLYHDGGFQPLPKKWQTKKSIKIEKMCYRIEKSKIIKINCSNACNFFNF